MFDVVQHPQYRDQARADDAYYAFVLKVLIAMLFIYPILHYNFLIPEDDTANMRMIETFSQEVHVNVIPRSVVKKFAKKIKPPPYKPPACHKSNKRLLISKLIWELKRKQYYCTPEDLNNLEKHKLPKSYTQSATSGKGKADLIEFLVVGLLLVSVGAAIVELYKAKSQQSPNKNKFQLTRKCSLADLTVLKHHRKELVRKDSIMELPESKDTGTNGNRSPLHY